jgi:hypothetical protein
MEWNKILQSPFPLQVSDTCTFTIAASGVAQNDDIFVSGSDIVYQPSEVLYLLFDILYHTNICLQDLPLVLGWVNEILVLQDGNPAVLTIYLFAWSGLDQHIHMPAVQLDKILLTILVLVRFQLMYAVHY